MNETEATANPDIIFDSCDAVFPHTLTFNAKYQENMIDFSCGVPVLALLMNIQ